MDLIFAKSSPLKSHSLHRPQLLANLLERHPVMLPVLPVRAVLEELVRPQPDLTLRFFGKRVQVPLGKEYRRIA